MRWLRGVGGAAVLGAMLIATGGAGGETPGPSGSPGPAVSVFPIPGSQVAPAGTQIAFRGVDPFALGSVSVSGSLSGGHTGRIEGDSDGQGGSFVPDVAFTPGEIVTVTTSLDLVGAPSGAYQFRVAQTPGPIPYAPATNVLRVAGDVLRFRSRPDLRPAAMRFLRGSTLSGGGDLLLAPQFGPLQDGPMIVDSQGRLVYFKPMAKGHVAADVQVQTYQGQRVLTYWQGFTNAGVGLGADEIYDSSYRQVAEVKAADGLSADLHEFLITPQNTALITAYYPVYWDTRAVGGPRRKIVLDSVVQEIDIPTGLELFQWDSLDHVPLTDSYDRTGRAELYDYFHVNSADLDADGNVIISGRNTWAAYKVDHSSAATLWTLGGKSSSFRLGPGAAFAFQHDVRAHGRGDREVSLFDDGGGPPRIHSSRALLLRLNHANMTAQVVADRAHVPSLSTRFQGNVDTLPGGQILVGWGQQPYITEFGARGRELLDARFVGGTSSYRAYAGNWTGTPATQPAVSGADGPGSTTVYASWNGSTQTAWWLFLGGSGRGSLLLRRAVPSTGFETSIRMARVRYVRVEALDVRGHILASSPIVRAH